MVKFDLPNLSDVLLSSFCPIFRCLFIFYFQNQIWKEIFYLMTHSAHFTFVSRISVNFSLLWKSLCCGLHIMCLTGRTPSKTGN